MQNVFAWNPNGLRSLLKNPSVLDGFLRANAPDVLFFTETKGNPKAEAAVDRELARVFGAALPDREWRFHHAYSDVPGRYGVSVAVAVNRVTVTAVRFGLLDRDPEGRVIVLECGAAGPTLVGVYVPNASTGLKRLQYKLDWLAQLQTFVASRRNVLVIGDLNVAPDERDICHPAANVKSPGFTPEERAAYARLLAAGDMVDVWRARHYDNPVRSLGTKGVYTFWDSKSRARERNVGWRIDLALLSRACLDRVVDCLVCGTVQGSDHCPVGLLWQNLPEANVLVQIGEGAKLGGAEDGVRRLS